MVILYVLITRILQIIILVLFEVRFFLLNIDH
nr:MAG TPA: hypothetical protein [Caudoviricetes sp.]